MTLRGSAGDSHRLTAELLNGPELSRDLSVKPGFKGTFAVLTVVGLPTNNFGPEVQLFAMARVCGHDHLGKFEQDDIATWHREMADLTGIDYSCFQGDRELQDKPEGAPMSSEPKITCAPNGPIV